MVQTVTGLGEMFYWLSTSSWRLLRQRDNLWFSCFIVVCFAVEECFLMSDKSNKLFSCFCLCMFILLFCSHASISELLHLWKKQTKSVVKKVKVPNQSLMLSKKLIFRGNLPDICKWHGVCFLTLHNYDFAAAVVVSCVTFSFSPFVMLKYLFEVIWCLPFLRLVLFFLIFLLYNTSAFVS